MKDKLNNIPASMKDIKELLDSITKGIKIRDELFAMNEQEITLVRETVESLTRRIEELENKVYITTDIGENNDS